MRSTSLIVIAGAAVTLAANAALAQTREYPFCAYGSKVSEGSARCDFATLAQCQAWLAGGSGSCIPNPRTTQGAGPQAPAGRR